MIWKFWGSKAGGRKSCGQSPCRTGGVSHQPEASCCTSGSLKAVTCHKVQCWAEYSSYSSCITHTPMLSFLLAFISLYQWGWGLLGWDISSMIQWQGYLTGSCLSLPNLAWDCKWYLLGEAAARTLANTPPAGAGLHWGNLVGVDGLAVKLGAFCSSGAASPTKKGARSEGKSGSLPNSSSAQNQTCFLGFSSLGREASCCHALYLGCNLRFSMEWWSHSSAGQDHGRLGVGDWCQLGCEGGLWCYLDPLLSLEQVLLLPDQDHLCCCLTSRTLGAPLTSGGQFSWPPFTSYASLGQVPRELPLQLLHGVIMPCMGEHAGCYHILTFIYLFCNSQKVWVLDPTKVCMLGCSGAACIGSRESLREHLWCSLCHIVAALWYICSSKNRLHSCLWVVFHPGCSFFIWSRNSWDQRAQSATQLKQPVLWVYSFACFPSIVKLPWCRVINSSIL